MIKAVIFDMFETLITHYRSPLYFGSQMAQDAGLTEEQFLPLWRATDEERTIGKLTLEEVLTRILQENHCYSEDMLQKLVAKRINTKKMCFVHLHEEMMPMFDALKENGVKIGLISNCYSEEAAVIRESILFPYFDAVFLSNEQGVKKPDKEIFRRCMDALSVSAEECVYIGDGGSYELETAESLGMKAVQAAWYLKQGTTQPTGRMDGFEHAETPLEVLRYVKNER